MAKEPDTRPQCENKVRTKRGYSTRCIVKGHACWVTGEFGRIAKVLCKSCVTALRARGWTVRYQLEGDEPAPLPTLTDQENFNR